MVISILLPKYITDTDMEKMFLIRDLLRLRQKYFECHEMKPYQEEPKFLKNRKEVIMTDIKAKILKFGGKQKSNEMFTTIKVRKRCSEN